MLVECNSFQKAMRSAVFPDLMRNLRDLSGETEKTE